jgi:hypothetical protein
MRTSEPIVNAAPYDGRNRRKGRKADVEAQEKYFGAYVLRSPMLLAE